jgi:hypothetical protein
VSTALRIVAKAILALVIAGISAWGALAIHYSSAAPRGLNLVLIGLLVAAALGAIGSLIMRRWYRPAFGALLIASVALFSWWSTIEPSNDREWKPEVTVLPQATREGDLVTIRNIRNFDYRTPTDFTPEYYDKTFDLEKLESVDLIASYWAGPAIAHIFVSFGFGDDDYLAVSIERRDEQGEGYSTIKGLFRQYEVFYVVADERDVIRLRTNIRNDPPEDVYVYRAQGPIENGRRLFLEYVRRINELGEQAEFYNTVTSNCAGNIWLNAHVNPGRIPYSWKILLSGHVPEYLYEAGMLDTSLPFAELKQRSKINDAAHAAHGSADFSLLIRKDLPLAAMP